MPTPIFFDPLRKRWRRVRRTIDVLGLTFTVLIAFFVVTVVRSTHIPTVLLANQKRNYRALKESERQKAADRRRAHRPNRHRKTKLPASRVVLNSGEGIRSAFYVTWDAASFSSLRENVSQIDLLYPEWLHVLTPDGRLQAVTELNTLYDVVKDGKPRPVDEKLMPFLKSVNAQTEVLPLVNNYDPVQNDWVDISAFFANPAARLRFRMEIMAFLATDKYTGLTLDLEGFPLAAQPGYKLLISELAADLHSRGLKLYISVPVSDEDFDYPYMAKYADGIILMDYDQHYPGGTPGAIAGEDWFEANLDRALKVIPRQKIICAIGNYGYDWSTPKGKKLGSGNVHNVSVQEAWLEAHDSEADIDFDSDSLNPHFTYLDENNTRHDVWYLDGVTALNEMRAAKARGISTFALWRLGSEDRTLWKIWDQPTDAAAPDRLKLVPPGQDVDMEGQGEIIHVQDEPQNGTRSVTVDPSSNLITDEEFDSLPTPYVLAQYGAKDKEVAITFDDGPDPTWTPKVLDVLKREHAHATFFIIGLEAEKYPDVLERVYRDGNEIGNHTFTHPDISSISTRYMKVEMNLTERLFAGKLGVKPVLFRPPYSVDQEPDTADEVRPLEFTQDMGYITVGDKIDPNDWRDNPRPTPQQIIQSVIDQLPNGNIILLHDGGGDRSHTVEALPGIIEAVRARGYKIVLVSDLLGKKYSDVMPPVPRNERFWAQVDAAGFWVFGMINTFIVLVFFLGDVLMSGRLLGVGTAACFDRFRRRKSKDPDDVPDFRPPVVVLVPAFNEESVIERTVRAVLDSNYPNLRVIVIDDGSTDATYDVACSAFDREIASRKLVVLHQENGGKARALNFGLLHVTEDIFVGIDADTVIAPDAISYLVPHFLDEKLGAIAGNAKVGNRMNLWTRWQALEYITSQNFERRALNVFSAVSVVPGAIGAWRTSAVREAGGYHTDTVAEDADLTMALLQCGYKVEYEDRALAYTEAPTTANGLMRQRFRWSFGIMQSTWKHRSAFKQWNALGLVALPNIVIFQILLPIVSPFIDIMFLYGTLKYLLWDKYFHPATADPASFQQLLLFFVLFLVIDFITSVIAFALERRQARKASDWWLLADVWLQRFAYRQLFSVVLIKTCKRAIDGSPFSWDKLERTATVKTPVVAGKV